MLKTFTVALVPISFLILLVVPISFAQNVYSQMPTPGATSTPQRAVVICAGNTAPAGTVVTATGSSPVCSGSCQARKIQPVRGDIMIICARQPIPRNYVLESVTTAPRCNCLGDQDNAYVIRLATTPTPTSTPLGAPAPFGGSQFSGSQYGGQEQFRVSH